MHAEYEIRDQRHGRIRLKIYIEGEREPIQHGVSVEAAKKHPDGVQAAIEESVERIAARHAAEEVPEEELPDGNQGQIEFEPGKEPNRPAEAPPSQRDNS